MVVIIEESLRLWGLVANNAPTQTIKHTVQHFLILTVTQREIFNNIHHIIHIEESFMNWGVSHTTLRSVTHHCIQSRDTWSHVTQQCIVTCHTTLHTHRTQYSFIHAFYHFNALTNQSLPFFILTTSQTSQGTARRPEPLWDIQQYSTYLFILVAMLCPQHTQQNDHHHRVPSSTPHNRRLRTTTSTTTATTMHATRCTAFKYGVVCAVVKSAAGFFANVKC